MNCLKLNRRCLEYIIQKHGKSLLRIRVLNPKYQKYLIDKQAINLF